MRKKLNISLLVILIAVTVYGSLSQSTGSGGYSSHLIAYFVLSTAFLINFHDTAKGHLEAIISAGGLALVLELLQSFIPYRTFSLADIGVSLAGASMVLLDHHLEIVTRFIDYEDRIIEKILST